MFIANNIRHLRKKLNFGQAHLALLLNVKQAAISAYELGRNEPNYEALEKLADLFGVTIDDLIRKDLSADAASEEGKSATPLPALVEELRREIADLRELVETQRALIDVLKNKNINK